MFIARDKLGIQTYSFRGFQGQEILDKVRACGLSHVELCTMQADFTNPQALEALLESYRHAQITIDALGVHGVGSPLDEAVFSFAQRAGIRVIGCDFAPTFALEGFRAAERLAERFDVRLAIHNHGGWHWLGSSQMLTAVFANTSQRIGLCLDTAWAMHSGENYLEMIRRFGKRLYGLHVKDFVFDRAHGFKDVVIGRGNLDLPALSQALEEVGYAGYAALEYEGEPEDPVPAITACVAAAREELCHV